MCQIGIVGITVCDRADHAEKVQHIITQYGDVIIARMGVPSSDRYVGIISIIMETDRDRIIEFVTDLEDIDGVKANYCML